MQRMNSFKLGSSFDEIMSFLPKLDTTPSTTNPNGNKTRGHNGQRGVRSQQQNQTNEQETENASNQTEEKREEKLNDEASVNSVSETAFYSAIYNTIAMAIFVACLALCFLLFVVLQTFIRPILWALLTSAFLFTFKKYLTDLTRSRLSSIERNGATLALELSFLLPFRLVDSFVDYIWTFFVSKYRHFAAIISFLLIYQLINAFYSHIVNFFLFFARFLSELVHFTTYYTDFNWKFTLLLVIIYLFTISFYWHQDYTAVFQVLSLPVWLSLLFLCSKLMGSYRHLFTFIILCLVIIGFYSFTYEYVMKFKRKMFQTTERSNEEDRDEAAPELIAESFGENPAENSTQNNIELTSNQQTLLNDSTQINELETNQINVSTVLSSSSSSESSLSDSFLKNTIYSIYQTSVYYFNSKAKPDNSKQNQHQNQTQAQTNSGSNNSDKYFIALFWLFVCIKFRYDLYISIPVIVLVWKFGKLICSKLFNLLFVENELIGFYFSQVKAWFQMRRAVFVPKPFSLLVKLFIRGDHKCNQLLQSSLDNLVSGLMIIMLILFLIITVIILAMQVHSESLELISLLSNILNENVYGNPELREWLPEKEKLNKMYLSTMNNFYLYGREWLSKNLKSSTSASLNMFANHDSTVSNQTDYLLVEAQILEQWDNLYAYLSRSKTLMHHNVTSNFSLVNSTSSSDSLSFNSNQNKTEKKNIWSFLIKRDSINYADLLFIVKDNLGILMSILDSLYAIVKGNLNLLITILYAVISTIFSSGFALVNFLFSFVVYITASFYLLSSSDSRYEPFQLMTDINIFKPSEQEQTNSQQQHQTTRSYSRSQMLIRAIEDSIRSVFLVSLKMALFYGLYTYLINCLFSVSIIYLTSIIAAFLAFLPLLGTYWVSIPGVLELWLIQNEPVYAIFYFFMHLFPLIISVDKAIYSEIKVGHPYMSSLAFAGGVYCLGLEGAIIGPIVLCLFIVIGKMLSNPTTTHMNNNTNSSIPKSKTVIN